jgi:LDH2 family malate/lactate/ureidoglycolate dehydrogenase
MPLFRPDDLQQFGIGVLCAAGATEEEATLIVGHALAALQLGEVNHGEELGTQYIAAVRDGTLKPGAPLSIEKETPTTLMVDGNFNFGHYVSHHVMLRLIEKAKVSNVAAASIRYQGHVGRLIDYTSMAAEEGMIALMMCDGAWGPKFVAPWGGKERRLGVNPWSVAMPHDTEGWLGFDMTSGTVSMMKVFRAAERGEQIPEGWIIDRDGKPTTDPADFHRGGSALPVGGSQGHKGYALAFVIEALADVLSGMEFREDLTRPWPIIDGCFMALFNVEAFRPLIDFKRDLSSFIEYVKSSALIEGAEGIFYPGERSHLNRARAEEQGVVAISDDVWQSVLGHAAEFDLAHTAPSPVSPAT